MDVSNYPPDMCPLCRQRALSLEGTQLDCTSCHAKAEFDAATRRIRYTAIPKRYEQFEAGLQDKWLSRAEAFEATELKPLPAVVFFPVIVSLLALCALFGLIGVVLAVRPSAGTTRQIIEDAYARQFSLQPVMTTTALLTVTVEVTGTVEVTLTPEALSPDAIGTATALALEAQNGLPPPELPTAQPPPENVPPTAPPTLPPPDIPTQPPTFTPPPEQPPTPTAPVQPEQPPTPTATSIVQSPLPVPGTPTPTTVANPALSSPTPTSTPTQLGPVILTGTVGITNVNAAAVNAFDEYVDILNVGPNPVTLVDWKIRVGGQVYNLSNPLGTQIQLLAQQGCRVFTGTNVGPVALPGEYAACGAKFLGVTSGTKIYPNSPGYQIELLNESNTVVAYFAR